MWNEDREGQSVSLSKPDPFQITPNHPFFFHQSPSSLTDLVRVLDEGRGVEARVRHGHHLHARGPAREHLISG